MKKTLAWIWFVASRYIFKGRGNSPVLSILGIAFGVLALIVIIAVMNGFQLGFIESILEISSYHVRLENIPEDRFSQVQKTVLAVPGVRAAVPFRELQVLAQGRRTGQQAVVVRGLPHDTLLQDRTMEKRLDFEEGSFNIADNESILMGSELARRLGLGEEDYVTMFSISGLFSAEEGGGLDDFTITGIFRTGFYEYDCSWAFVNIDNEAFFSDEAGLILGVKLSNRFHDRFSMELIKRRVLQLGGLEEIKFSSWRDYNRSFFGALRTEKLFMFILVGLIFIVVGLNIFQAQRRAVLQRREEIGLLRAVGGTEKAVRLVFLCDGAVIGLTGAFLGLVFGLFIALNIPQFFTVIENMVNSIIGKLNVIAGFFGAQQAEDFAVFSPAVFYIKEIPSRILVQEVILIFMFGFLSALAAAWFASRKAAKINPAEVMRYE